MIFTPNQGIIQDFFELCHVLWIPILVVLSDDEKFSFVQNLQHAYEQHRELCSNKDLGLEAVKGQHAKALTLRQQTICSNIAFQTWLNFVNNVKNFLRMHNNSELRSTTFVRMTPSIRNMDVAAFTYDKLDCFPFITQEAFRHSAPRSAFLNLLRNVRDLDEFCCAPKSYGVHETKEETMKNFFSNMSSSYNKIVALSKLYPSNDPQSISCIQVGCWTLAGTTACAVVPLCLTSIMPWCSLPAGPCCPMCFTPASWGWFFGSLLSASTSGTACIFGMIEKERKTA